MILPEEPQRYAECSITFLGTRGYIEQYSQQHRYHTAILLRQDGYTVLIDFGEINRGALPECNDILISHCHPDHVCQEINEVKGRVFMSTETHKRLDKEKYPVEREVFKYSGEELKIGPFSVRSFPVLHSTKCPMSVFKVGTARALVGIATDIVGFHTGDRKKFFEDLDIWICDGSSFSKPLVRRAKEGGIPIGHASLVDQLKNWTKDAKESLRIIITHLGTEPLKMGDEKLAEAAREYHKNVEVAYDGYNVIL